MMRMQDLPSPAIASVEDRRAEGERMTAPSAVAPEPRCPLLPARGRSHRAEESVSSP